MCIQRPTDRVPRIEDSPYFLKRRGRFQDALDEYACRLAEAHREGNEFVAEKCFEQIFDICLLLFLRERRPFSSPTDLRGKLNAEIGARLKEHEALDQATYDRLFSDCWARFSPRGGGRSPFAVDRRVLLGQEMPT